MADTIRNQDAFTNASTGLFRDGQAAGSITPQDVRDFVVSVPTLVLPKVYNVRSYGAFGDGTRRAASTIYGSLSALQAVFSFATALTNEIDWLAAQAAINAAQAAGGGTVYFPGGQYMLTNTSSAGDGSGTLTLPETGSWTSGTSIQGDVNLLGDGAGVSAIRTPNDLGTGEFALTCTNRSTTSSGSSGFIQDLLFWGPQQGVSFGTSPANMHGIGWSARRQMTRVKVVGYKGGVCICGDQTRFTDVWVQNCYDGFYWDVYNTNLFGDHLFERCAVVDGYRSGLCVSNGAAIGESIFVSCTFAQLPWGVFKETGGTQNIIFDGCSFYSSQFEGCGNGWIGDGLAAGSHLATMSDTRFVATEFQWNSAAKIASQPATAIIQIQSTTNGVIFDGFRVISLWTPGSSALFEIDNLEAAHFRGNIDGLISNCGSKPFVAIAANTTDNTSTVESTSSGWGGRLLEASGTVAVQDVVVWSGGGYVARSGGVSSEQVAGVIMIPNFGSASAVTIVATSGWVWINTAALLTQGNLVRTGASGKGVAASGFADTTSPAVGYCRSPGGSNPYFCKAELKAL